MNASEALKASVIAYTGAKNARQKAVRAIYDEIVGLLKEAGLKAAVIVRGSNSFNTLAIEIRLPDDGSTLLVDETSADKNASNG